jgi:serine/threonine-protein kinase HipA
MSSMTSDKAPAEAYVWLWLPDQAEPVVAGRLEATAQGLQFNYGRSYLARNEAIALYDQ